MTTSCTFCILTDDDTPLYIKDFSVEHGIREALNHFVIHAALDVMDQLIWTTPQMYVRCVDQFEEKLVYGLITASRLFSLSTHHITTIHGSLRRGFV
ncbi:hypothetical protein RCL1_003030 [Eukaryota sp. TZLM3-RCL]